MNTKVINAVNRLNKILPLSRNLQSLNKEQADVYQNILRSYAEQGASLNKHEITRQVENIDEAIKVLKENDMVVFDDDDEPIGAYPFTMEQREHEVAVNDHKVHCMCALDALAVSPMFDRETTINSICHVTGEPVSIQQRNREIINSDDNEDVYFGLSWNSAANNCCATSLCTEMIFLKGQQVADQWLAEDAENREIFNLSDAVDFAAGFFVPLMTYRAA
jgi:mercuric reductase